MLPLTGETCKFSFKPSFVDLNGIYKILSINTLDELLSLGIDMVVSTYEKVGLSELEYQTDVVEFKSDKIYKLENVNTADIVYMPTSFNLTIPDPNIREYLHLGLAVNIGIFKDIGQIEWIKSQIGQALAAVVGVDKEPTLFELESAWLTEPEYATIEAERSAYISTVTNHFIDKQLLLDRIARQNTIIAEYEQTLKLLQ